MGLLLPRKPLTPTHKLRLDVDPARCIVRAGDIAAYITAEEAVDAARGQAEHIVAEAKAAYESERRRGYEEGLARARTEEARRMMELVVRSDDALAKVEDGLVNAVLKAVRTIVYGYDERERVVHSLRSALAVVRNQKQITFRVHPDRADDVKARTSEFLASYPGVSLIDVLPDPRLAADACVVESEIGIVEAGTEGQLAALDAALVAALRKARAIAA